MSAIQYEEVKTMEDFNSLVNASKEAPVLLCKYSPTCPVSGEARSQIETFLANTKNLKAYSIDVIASRETSRALATEINIKHESPQVLFFKDGQCKWNESHFRITVETLEKIILPELS